FTGFATLRDALSGARFGHFNASPHTLQPATSSEDHVLLFVLHEGCGQAITATHSESLQAGDALLLTPHSAWKLVLETDFRATAAVLSDTGFTRRLLGTQTDDLHRLGHVGPLGRVAAEFMRSVGDQLDALDPADLAQIEAVLTGMALSGLAHDTFESRQPETSSVQL